MEFVGDFLRNKRLMPQIYLVLGDARNLVSNRLINSRLIYLLVIERLRYI